MIFVVRCQPSDISSPKLKTSLTLRSQRRCEILSFYSFDLAEAQRRGDVDAFSILRALCNSAVK